MEEPVFVVQHNVQWARTYDAQASLLKSALGAALVAIHHIGSTSISGIVAKPVIDILIEAKALGRVDEHQAAVESLGYEALGEFGIPCRRFFRRVVDGRRMQHVHAFLAGSAEAKRHLAFRDYLRSFPHRARAYSELKVELASRHGITRQAYGQGKSSLIEELEGEALAWVLRQR